MHFANGVMSPGESPKGAEASGTDLVPFCVSLLGEGGIPEVPLHAAKESRRGRATCCANLATLTHQGFQVP